MSDSDRGAYAPHYDEALSLDGYDRRPRGRAPMPMALVGSVIVLLLVCTALVMFYRSGAKGSAGLPRPVGGKIGAIKVAPSGAQPTEPGMGLEVYSPQNVPSANAVPPAPRFAPAPEQPIARPTPPPAAVAVKPAPVVATSAAPILVGSPGPAPAAAPIPAAADPSLKVVVAKPKLPAVASPAADSTRPALAATPNASEPDEVDTLLTPSKVAAASANAAKLASAKAATQKLVAAAARRKSVEAEDADADEYVAPSVLPRGPISPTKPTAAKATTTHAPTVKAPLAAMDAARPAPKGGFSVQVGAFTSSALAQKGFDDAAKKAGGVGGGARSVKAVQKDGKTFYRSTIAGFASREAAAAYCAAVRAKGGPCIVH